MRTRVLATLAAAAGLWVWPGDSAHPFSTVIPKPDRALHALNRLTFGPRSGDVEAVKAAGVKKWIAAQLHPETIAENPVLAKKLALLDTLRMSSREIVENYPPPQALRLIADGRQPYPSDPARKAAVERMVARYQQQQKGERPSARPDLSAMLTPQQIRTLRAAGTAERIALVEALPPEKQDALVAALPRQMRAGLMQAASPELRRRVETMAAPQQVIAQDLTQAKIYRAVYSNRQLEEVLVDFWYNHFNIFLDKGADRYLVTEYERDVIRPRVLGKFPALLEATAKSPAMLFYLDNWQSVGAEAAAGRRPGARRGRGLNENYGRELLELHTLGVDGGYTQQDVTEVARCFTGWTIQDPQRGGSFTFNARFHDSGEKTVLGVKIPAGGGIEDGMKVIEIVSHHPATARFISRKLAQRFVADQPPASLVDRMAATFGKTDGDLRAVLQTMFDAKEFWSGGAYRAKLKSPFEMVVSAVRASGADVDSAQALANQVAQLGQPLYRKLEPTGYSNSGPQWMNSAGLLARMNFAVQLGENRVPGVKGGDAVGTSLGSPEFQRR